MKKNSIQHWFLLVLISVGLRFTLPAQAPEFLKSGTEAGLLLHLSRVEGDGPSYLRQNSSDVSTNFGTKAYYTRHWAKGFGVYVARDIQLYKFIRIRLETQVSRYSGMDSYRVAYDPALPSGLAERTATVRNDYYNFSPYLAIKGGWRGIDLSIGLMANIFAYGHTLTRHGAILSDGTKDDRTEAARLDSQGQPIYQDQSQFGGIADYTNINLRNHGASTIWWAGVAKASWRIVDRKRSPVIGFSWQLPFTEIQRSQNPRFSLISGYSQDLHEIYQGVKISTMSMHIGWAF
jgi:hypothetical protein